MKKCLTNYEVGDLVEIVMIDDKDDDVVIDMTDKFVGTIAEIVSIDDDTCPITCKTDHGRESFKLTEIELFKKKPMTIFE